jgi:hypothetical protein
MRAVTLRATVDESRRLTVDLPADIPAGPVEVTIRPLATPTPAAGPLTREVVREKLRAAGLLAEGNYAPPDAVPLSPEERERLGRLFAGPRPITELIDEDRGER